MKKFLPSFFFFFLVFSMLCSVWARSFLSSINGKLNIDFCFQLKKHKPHFKKINLPNSNYKEHILGTCIIQEIAVYNNEGAQVLRFFLLF